MQFFIMQITWREIFNHIQHCLLEFFWESDVLKVSC